MVETKFAQKGCFQSKIEKVIRIIEFCILELLQITHFSWNLQSWLFFAKFIQKACFRPKTAKPKKTIEFWIFELF